MTPIGSGKGRIITVSERPRTPVPTMTDRWAGEPDSLDAVAYDVVVAQPDGSMTRFTCQLASADDPAPQVGTEVEYELRSLG